MPRRGSPSCDRDRGKFALWSIFASMRVVLQQFARNGVTPYMWHVLRYGPLTVIRE